MKIKTLYLIIKATVIYDDIALEETYNDATIQEIVAQEVDYTLSFPEPECEIGSTELLACIDYPPIEI